MWLLPGKPDLISLAIITYALLEVIINTTFIRNFPETFKPPESQACSPLGLDLGGSRLDISTHVLGRLMVVLKGA